MKSLEKIIDELKEEYLKSSPHATEEELIKVLKDAKTIIQQNKDATPEEIINIMMDDCVQELNEILESYPTPGILSSLRVDNIDIHLHGGVIRKGEEELSQDALFDVASITKLYTEVIAYKLINEGAFRLSDKIKELDPRFENVGDLTVSDVLKFIVTFKTNGRIDDASTRDEAEEKLFGMEVIQRGEKYNYNDMGLMLMKEVMEQVTKKTYEELFKEYILKPYELKNTHIIVPKSKIHLVTGTPNLDGSVNDLKANIMGGYSGHAGVRATSGDLLTMLQKMANDQTVNQNGDIYVPNTKMNNRSEKIGNAYTNPEFFTTADGTVISGKERSYFGRLAPKEAIASQGSTRVIARTEKANNVDISTTALTNIASMTDEEMREMIRKENEKRLAQDKEAKLLREEDLMKTRNFDGVIYGMKDPRALMNEDKTIGRILYKYDNEIILKLLLVNKILKEQEHYDKEINIDRDITKGRVH